MTRRIIKLLAAAGIVVGATLAFSTPAHASEETIGHCVEETFHELEEEADGLEGDALAELEEEFEGRFEDCVEAPNQLLPETNEIIWGGIGFLVVFVFLAKFGFPAIKKSMNDRTERIRSDVDAAENAKTEANRVLDEYKGQLADARTEAGRIIEEARQTADTMKRDQEARLQEELAQMRARAQADIEASKEQAMADLQSDVADLAIGAAEAVVQQNLDRQTQLQLIENYINQVGERS